MITSGDLFLILFLVFLEGILSIDNALVLAVLARDLPKEQQRKALTYGLIGAFVFRLLSLGIVTYLMQWNWVKYVGGGYLLFISLKHFLKREPKEGEHAHKHYKNFWKVVIAIELTDIAFAIDSILAAVALTPKFWIVFTGGVMGVILMRFAASFLIVIMDKFPKLDDTAYQLVFLIGLKLILEALHIPGLNFHQVMSPAALGFWGLVAVIIVLGFRKPKPSSG